MDAKVILLKTIDNVQVVYYRVLNLDTFETMDIPAYRIMDENLSEDEILDYIDY